MRYATFLQGFKDFPQCLKLRRNAHSCLECSHMAVLLIPPTVRLHLPALSLIRFDPSVVGVYSFHVLAKRVLITFLKAHVLCE